MCTAVQKSQGGQALIILWGFEPWDLPLQTATVQTVHTTRLLTSLQPQHQARQQRLQQFRSEELVQTKPHTRIYTDKVISIYLALQLREVECESTIIQTKLHREVSYLLIRDFTRLHDVILKANCQYKSSVPFLAQRTTAIERWGGGGGGGGGGERQQNT